ncbi:hypothetical protein WH52_12305 [Tenacibaculum holothuriorum]|uniref:DUF2971 domain-containing protein n=2 Tax=Tenacibaculum holothuriorum TaxID=1635173 RepID=A0A1Y2PC40_9FLAO|nr:hypothetical protein WH52_12305 [Tenacibaculum holothuriorum]
MNDYLEIDWFLNLINKEVDKVKDEENSGLLNSFKERVYNANIGPYICCFSNAKDKLSQWRAYASDGKGVAIGIDRGSLNINNTSTVSSLDNNIDLRLLDVCYDKTKQNMEAKSIVELICNEKNAEGELVRPGSAYHHNKSIEALIIASMHKNPAFIEEEEVRIVYTPHFSINQDNYTATNNSLDPIKFRMTGNKLTSYFEFPIKSNSIKEVVLGPKCEINSSELKTLLNIETLNHVEINQSKASYR